MVQRPDDISMVFQEPQSSFSPVYTIGNQIMEAIVLHQGLDRDAARKRAIQALEEVGMPKASQTVDSYPHQLSGGMRQRAMIAMALSCNPRLLIADEPTTALDVTIQAQILELLLGLQKARAMSILIITHAMGVIAETAQVVSVMYLGKVVESAFVDEIFRNPLHRYARSLLKAIPSVERRKSDRLYSIEGTVPDASDVPPGCPFHPRCPEARPGVCSELPPAVAEPAAGHRVRCLQFDKTVSHAWSPCFRSAVSPSISRYAAAA